MESTLRLLDKEKLSRLFEPGEAISRTIQGFEKRAAQIDMLHNVIDAYNNGKISLIEAGTGTGKSMAYLIPAIAWAMINKQRTVISTATIALQEQLVYKDIPLVMKALNANVKAVLVKGMGNYLCKRRLDDTRMELNLLAANDAQQLRALGDWAHSSTVGSRSDIPFTPSGETWEKVRAESDSCNAQQCPHYKECFFFQARAETEDAQILVVNHHLLFADLARRGELDMREPGLLPNFTRVIIDEAHHIESIATDFFADQASLLEMLRNLAKLTSEKGDSQTGQAQESKGRLVRLRERVMQLAGSEPPAHLASIRQRLETDLPAIRQQLLSAITELFTALAHYLSLLVPGEAERREKKLRLLPVHSTHPYWIETVQPNGKILLEELERYVASITSLLEDIANSDHETLLQQTQGARSETQAYLNRLGDAGGVIRSILFGEPDPQQVRWIATQTHRGTENSSLTSAALDVSQALADHLFSKFPTIVLCSATLTTNRHFHFYRQRLGLTQEYLAERTIEENLYNSPFNFAEQALLAIPNDIPPPNAREFLQRACERIWECVNASKGNTFILFTSYSMLQQAYDVLYERLSRHRYPPMRQGEESRQKLLQRFRTTEYSVLFGTDSFWEGVDVAGEALRCVIIVKLPFQVPSEPIVEARTEAILAQGGNPFMDYAVPNAIMKFKQGFGRLIRKHRDRGCIVCLDSRLINKPYGQLFLNSLPQCRRHDDGATLFEEMRSFYRKTYAKFVVEK